MRCGADKVAERVQHSSVWSKDGRGCCTGSASSSLFEPCFRKLPCSLPHQSSSTSPITTFAPGQLLSPYLRVSCPRTSTTSSSHIPQQLLSLPPSARQDCINTPDWTQLALSRTSWVCLHRLPVLAVCSGLLLHLTCSGFVPCGVESSGPEKAWILSRSLHLQFYELWVTITQIMRLTWINLHMIYAAYPLLDQN